MKFDYYKIENVYAKFEYIKIYKIQMIYKKVQNIIRIIIFEEWNKSLLNFLY